VLLTKKNIATTLSAMIKTEQGRLLSLFESALQNLSVQEREPIHSHLRQQAIADARALFLRRQQEKFLASASEPAHGLYQLFTYDICKALRLRFAALFVSTASNGPALLPCVAMSGPQSSGCLDPYMHINWKKIPPGSLTSMPLAIEHFTGALRGDSSDSLPPSAKVATYSEVSGVKVALIYVLGARVCLPLNTAHEVILEQVRYVLTPRLDVLRLSELASERASTMNFIAHRARTIFPLIQLSLLRLDEVIKLTENKRAQETKNIIERVSTEIQTLQTLLAEGVERIRRWDRLDAEE